MRRLIVRGGLAWALTGVVLYACGGEDRRFVDSTDTGGTGSGGDTGGTTGGGKGGTSGGGGTNGGRGGSSPGGAAGGGGEGGDVVEPPPPGRPGTALVSGGMWMESENFRLYSTTGFNAFPHNASSSNFRLRGGIVATTLPEDE